jgi:hypothetical protein
LPRQNHAAELWKHIWGDYEERLPGRHKEILMKIVDAELPELKREGHHSNLKETCFAVLARAVALKERDDMPLTGLSRDRRVLSHIDEVCIEPKSADVDVSHL